MRRRQFSAFGAAAAAAPWLAGCGLIPPPTTVPMGVTRLRAPCAATTLVVMLPGAYSRPQEFIDEGYVGALRSRGIAADVWIADAHLRYFEEKSAFERLHADVIRPAREAGYRQVWLVGISLGGFAALGCAARHADELTGVLAIAPYLGQRQLLQEIRGAGGPRAWAAAGAAPAPTEMDRRIWWWLGQPATPIPVWLGYGREDRFADAHGLLAGVLPAERVNSVPGDHDWPAWRALWNGWLDRGLLPRGCAA